MSLQIQDSSAVDSHRAADWIYPVLRASNGTDRGDSHVSVACAVQHKASKSAKTKDDLWRENRAFKGTTGVSAENRQFGFRPAFLDTDTGEVYASCFANGQPAPFHLLDGLPDEIVVGRHPSGRVAAVKESITSGFVCEGTFYTREQASEKVMSNA